jgi:hypothetical protein
MTTLAILFLLAMLALIDLLGGNVDRQCCARMRSIGWIEPDIIEFMYSNGRRYYPPGARA